jgi:hypothetical protein
MSKSLQRFGSVALGLFAVLTAAAGTAHGSPPADRPAQAPNYRLSGPFTHENLTIYLIHGEDKIKDKNFLTLQEALAQKKVIVHETQNVNQLSIENTSADEVFVQAGDIVKGGQQDRVIAYDLVVPAHSGKMPIASFCVEAGRWTQRGRESVTSFDSSMDQAPTKGLKMAVRQDMAQQKVWENVDKAQKQLEGNLGGSVRGAASASSLQLTLENEKLTQTTDAYVKKLVPIVEGKKDVLGYAVAINGKISSADIYISHGLFQKLWPVLLKGSAVEALVEMQKDKKKFATPSAEAVLGFLADAERGKTSTQEVTKRVRLVQHETDKGILFETRDTSIKDMPALRCSVISK